MANEVKLVFAGDATSLTKTFTQVGTDATTMGGKVDKAGKDVGGGFDRMGEGAQGTTTHMRGMADVADGLGTVLGNTALGPVAGMAMGVADLADGIGTTVLPMLQGLITKLGATTIATNLAAAAQGALNMVMSLNPIMLVVIAIGLLVAAFVVAWKNSETFRDVVRGAFDKIKEGVEALVTIMGTVAEAITAPYRIAFAAIKTLWNSTIGGFRFEVPDWIPGVGGNGFSIPSMHSGGVVPGAPGTEMLALLQAGERVTPAGGGAQTIVVNVSGVGMGRDFGNAVAQALRDNRLIGVT